MKDRIAEWTEATIAHWVISAPDVIWRNIWFEVCDEGSYEKIADDRCLKILMCITEYCAQDCIFPKDVLHTVLARYYRKSKVTNGQKIKLLVDDEGRERKHDSGFGWFTSKRGAAIVKDFGYGNRRIKDRPEPLKSRVRGRASYVMCKDVTAEKNLRALRKTLFETHAYAVSDDFRAEMRDYLMGSVKEGHTLRSYTEFERRSIAILNHDMKFSCQRRVTERIRDQLPKHGYTAEPGRNMVKIRKLRAPIPELVWIRREVGGGSKPPPILYKKEIEHSLIREAEAG